MVEGEHETETGGARGRDDPLALLEQLLAIEATGLDEALDEAAQLVSTALAADKVDAFLYDPATATLVARGTSDTPLGRRQHAIGLDRLPLANGGRTVRVFQAGAADRSGRLDRDPEELPGIVKGLGVRSSICVPLLVAGERRGALLACSAQPEYFTVDDLHYLEVVGRWVGMVARRAELIERLAAGATEAGRRDAAEQVITVLAHDLRNYLTPLKFHLALLGEHAEAAGRADDVQHAATGERLLGRLNRLIHDLLDVGRIEQGLFALDVQPVNLAALVGEMGAKFRSDGAEVLVQAPHELLALVDAERLRHALGNLLANAVRFAPEGIPVALGVAAEQRADGRWAVVTVADQGPGIAPELMPRLFGRFAPGPGSLGLGLGLYLASRIAAAHGGTLTADSTPGAGTRFQLALPAGDPLGER
jgi:two-component system OmpR family sensor kinase